EQLRPKHRAKVVRMRLREPVRIAYADDPRGRVVTEQERRECDRRHDRLEAARRQRDDQPLGLTEAHALERISYGLKMPVRRKRATRRDDGEDAACEGIEIPTHDCVEEIALVRRGGHDASSLWLLFMA